MLILVCGVFSGLMEYHRIIVVKQVSQKISHYEMIRYFQNNQFYKFHVRTTKKAHRCYD